MAKRQKHRLGREAINMLMKAYLDGTKFTDVFAVRAFVIRELGVKPTSVSVDAAGNWDRQARLELADDGVAVTFPSRKIGFQRDPNADATTRSASHRTDLLYLATRSENALRSAKASASQIDAKRKEIERHARLEIAVPILKLISELDA